jgi:hypothetical protein
MLYIKKNIFVYNLFSQNKGSLLKKQAPKIYLKMKRRYKREGGKNQTLRKLNKIYNKVRQAHF